VAPGSVALRASKRRRIAKLLRSGFPITVESDEPVGVTATLRVASSNGNGSKSSRMVARASTSVGVSGLASLRLEPTPGAKRLLAGRDLAVASLRVVTTDAAGRRTTFRRRVNLLNGGGDR
jgi:hypothetical protein